MAGADAICGSSGDAGANGACAIWAATCGNSPVPMVSPSASTTARNTVLDRKSTRLNSSHLGISYAVFCLKKKKRKRLLQLTTLTPESGDCAYTILACIAGLGQADSE